MSCSRHAATDQSDSIEESDQRKAVGPVPERESYKRVA